PAERIVAKVDRLAAARRHQPVLDVIGVGGRARGGEVAVAVVAEATRAGGRVLVERIDAVRAAAVLFLFEFKTQ
ncbi:MAG: hypothetical protein M3177_02830, partial [Pseudomonadota bacterium]|nr:hypothetical protein [Pseudomonadota bacterium]